MTVRINDQIVSGTFPAAVQIGDMGFAPLGIDESLNLRRYLNGQLISQTQFVSFTNKVKSAVVLFPSLTTTEENWQAEKSLSKFGQVGKFVIDDTAQTIRLPAVVNAQGLLELSGIGNLVNESLPNITGSLYNANTIYQDIGLDDGSGTGAIKTVTDSYSRKACENIDGYDNNNLGWNFDASRSSSTYQDNAPVQQEAVQYPYYIQVATGVEETLPSIREYKVNNSDYFGKSMYSDIAPDNASWLVSNGSYNARSIYPDYYDWLLTQYNNPTESNVVKSGSVTDNNGVLSGFSSANNAILPVTFSPANNPWEIVIKLKTPQTFTEQGLISKTHQNGINYGLRIALSASGRAYYLIGSSYNTFICEGIGVQTLNVDASYYIKFEFTGEAYKAYISTDAVTWTEDFSFSTTTPIESFDEPTYLGDNKYKNIPFVGSIDLNECYININGHRWWNGRKAVVIKTGETSIYSDYDFVINQDNQTFRLPLLNGEETIPSNTRIENPFTKTVVEGESFIAPYNGFLYLEMGHSGLRVIRNGFQQIFVGTANGTSAGQTIFLRKGDVCIIYPWNDGGVAPVLAQSWFIRAQCNGTLYYYVGDIVQDVNLINAGAVLGQLSNKANVSNTVTTDTTQTISGSKRFTQPPEGMSIELVADTNQQIVPTVGTLRQMGIYRNSTYTKGDGYTSWIQGYRGSDGWSATELYTRRFLEGDSQEIINYLRVDITPDGTPVSYTKTPPDYSAGEEIVTAGWFRLSTCSAKTVIETYKSGSNWYRVWSDGWIEQGGFIVSGDTTITFLKPFTNTNYIFQSTTKTGNSDRTIRGVYPVIGTLTTTSLSVFTCPNYSGTNFYWQACGY